MDSVVIKIKHDVDLGGKDAQAIYSACVSGMLNGSFSGEINPLRVDSRDGDAVIGYVDIGAEIFGYRPLDDAVSDVMAFDQMTRSDDIEAAIAQAEEIAGAFDKQAARLRRRVKELRAT